MKRFECPPDGHGPIFEYEVKPYWTHKRVSFLKSALRMASSVFALAFPYTLGVIVLAVGYGLAEVLGVWEEVGSRGE